jgi:hypothetical protein
MFRGGNLPENSEILFSNNNGGLQCKVGNEEYQKRAVGEYSIHDISNENGNLGTYWDCWLPEMGWR